MEMMTGLQLELAPATDSTANLESTSPASHRPPPSTHQDYGDFNIHMTPRRRATYRQLAASDLAEPTAQLLDNLQRERVDLEDLRDNTDRLVTRTYCSFTYSL